MTAATATDSNSIDYTTLVVGDTVEYRGSVQSQHGRSFVVVYREPVEAVHLAAIAEGRDPKSLPEAYRYEIENVAWGVRLSNVRRQSVVLIGK